MRLLVRGGREGRRRNWTGVNKQIYNKLEGIKKSLGVHSRSDSASPRELQNRPATAKTGTVWLPRRMRVSGGFTCPPVDKFAQREVRVRGVEVGNEVENSKVGFDVVLPKLER